MTNCSIHNTDLLQHCGFNYPTLNPNINLFHCGRGVAFAMLFRLPLYPPPIFAIKSVYTMAGSELSGRPPGQLTYSFIRGAAKQHGTLVFNDVCTYTMWGHKVLVCARLFGTWMILMGCSDVYPVCSGWTGHRYQRPLCTFRCTLTRVILCTMMRIGIACTSKTGRPSANPNLHLWQRSRPNLRNIVLCNEANDVHAADV